MKKDCEFPWVIRIARWAALAYGICWLTLEIVHKASEVFA